MSKGKKKEHAEKKTFLHFNSFTFEWQNSQWECQEIADRSEGHLWFSRLVYEQYEHFRELTAKYGSHTMWNSVELHHSIMKALEYDDGYFLRWWLDQWVRKVGEEIWNWIFESVRRIPGESRTDDNKGIATAEEEVKKWFALVA